MNNQGGYAGQPGFGAPIYIPAGYEQPGYNPAGGYNQPGYNPVGYNQPGYNPGFGAPVAGGVGIGGPQNVQSLRTVPQPTKKAAGRLKNKYANFILQKFILSCFLKRCE